MNKARVMYFKLGDSYSFEPAEVAEKGLSDLHTLIDCDLVEGVCFDIKGVEYTLWCDEEFLLKENPVATMFFGNLKHGQYTIICGNFVVCKYGKGEHSETIISLTDKEIADIRAFIDEGQIKLKLAFANGLLQ